MQTQLWFYFWCHFLDINIIISWWVCDARFHSFIQEMYQILLGTHLKRIRHEVFQGGSTCFPLTLFLLYVLSPVLLIDSHTAISLQDQKFFNLAAWYWTTTWLCIFFSMCLSTMSLIYSPARESGFAQSVIHFVCRISRCILGTQICIAAPVGN